MQLTPDSQWQLQNVAAVRYHQATAFAAVIQVDANHLFSQSNKALDVLLLDAAVLPSIVNENPSLDCTPMMYVAVEAVVYRYP